MTPPTAEQEATAVAKESFITALSVRRLLAWAALGLMAASCGRPASQATVVPQPTVEPSSMPVEVVVPTPPPRTVGSGKATVGPPIHEDGRTLRLESIHGDRILGPVRSIDGYIIVESLIDPRNGRADVDPGYQFLLWRPETGEFLPAWSAEPGHQDIISDGDGEWVATVRAPRGLPFPGWSVIIRNPITGEARTIAESDPGVAGTPGLGPKLPLGLAPPAPSISSERVVWDEIRMAADGSPRDRGYLYDIATGTRTVLFDIDPRVEEAYSITIGGERAAWVLRPTRDGPFEIHIRDLGTGAERIETEIGGPNSAALSKDGRYLAWDDGMLTKWALNLATGERVQYAGREGWSTIVSGQYVSWVPLPETPNKGGFYDFKTGVVRFIESRPEVFMQQAWVMGEWFVWQQRPGGDLDQQFFYFLPLKP